MAAKVQGTRPSTLSVNFTGVEVRKGGDYIPPGDYLVRVIDGMVRPNQDGDGSHVGWTLEVIKASTGSKFEGKKIFYRTTLKDTGLWKLRSFLVDMLGEDKVPAKKLEIPFAKIIAKKPLVGISTEDDEYKGKTKTDVTGTFPKADWETLMASKATDEEEEEEEEAEAVDEEEEEEEEAPAPKKTKKAAAPVAEEEEEEGEEMEELDTDEL